MIITHVTGTYRVRNDGELDRRYKTGKGSSRIVSKRRKISKGKNTHKKGKNAFGVILLAYTVFMAGYLMEENTVEAEVMQPVVERKTNFTETERIRPECVGKYKKLICNPKYKWDVKKINAIITCESGWNPEAFNINVQIDGVRSVDRGLMMINSRYHPQYKPSTMFNAEKNIQAGYEVWESAGYGAWAVFEGSCYRGQL